MAIYDSINKLVSSMQDKKLIEELDFIYCYNRILAKLNIAEVQNIGQPCYIKSEQLLSVTLKEVVDEAVSLGLIEDLIGDRDRLDTEIMDVFMPMPSLVTSKFNSLYNTSPIEATNYFYCLSKLSNYIRWDRIKKNRSWLTNTEYGELEITINLSKPEKDPRAIAKDKSGEGIKYPKCLLCKENVGYTGRIDHPARANHRILPYNIGDERWYIQYSPYVYFNEHCIFFSDEHRPMKITSSTFDELLECVTAFPHYFAGSNADLPIVGGSILAHNHFQGGRYDMPINNAKTIFKYNYSGAKDIDIEIVRWPLSIIRITGENKARLSDMASILLENWQSYDNEELGILSNTDGEPHNTITPIARRIGDKYQLDLTLRNNRTSQEYPMGIFHPHENLHHIKRENIGLIEVMGLAILPGRLDKELDKIKDLVVDRYALVPEELNKHSKWIQYLRVNYRDDENLSDYIKMETGKKFLDVLKDAGVFKDTPKGFKAFKDFITNIKVVM